MLCQSLVNFRLVVFSLVLSCICFTINAQNGIFSYQLDSTNCNGAYYTFSLDTPVTVVSWNFGDGTILNSGDTVQHVYSTLGTYTVILEFDTTTAPGNATVSSAVQVTSVFYVDPDALNVACFGDCDGVISLTPVGGTAPFAYAWDNGVTTSGNTGLCGNTSHSYTVTDASGCIFIDSVYITEPPPFVVDITSTWNNNISTLTASANGGAGSYLYQWNTGSNSNPISVSATGTYHVTVTDANGCTVTDSINFLGCSALTAAVSPNSSCDTSCTGNISVTVHSGKAPFSYTWSTGDTSQNLTNLCAGTYQLTITDSLGCVFSFSRTISDGTLTSYSTGYIAEECSRANGRASIFTTTANIQWDANVGGGTNNTITGLASGYYHFTLTDIGGCTIEDSVFVPQIPISTSASFTYATCEQADGSAYVSSNTTNPPITVTWDNGSTGDSITGLVAGVYIATITDAAGCMAVDTIQVIDSCAAIQGHIFEDLNGNGVKDFGEAGMPGVTITTTPGNLKAVSDNQGNYSIVVSSFGTYAVDLVLPMNRFSCSGQIVQQPVLTLPTTPSNYTVTPSSGTPIIQGNDFGVNFPPPPCGTISGTIFDDQNGNGVQDAGEGGLSNILVQLSNGQQAFSNTLGYYELETLLDSPLVVGIVLSNNGTAHCNSQNNLVPTQTSPSSPDTYSLTLTVQNPNSFNNDFGVQNVASGFDVGIYAVSAYAGVHAGRCFHANMDIKRYGTIPSACTLRLEFDTLVHFVSADLMPDTTGPGFVEWHFPQNDPLTYWCYSMEFCLDEAAEVGDLLTWHASWSCDLNDFCSYNDELTTRVAVKSGPAKAEGIGGFNQKVVYHSGDQVNGIISENDTVLSYEINFQNTGTDTAYHLTIRDTLSPYLKPESLTRAFSSHDHSYFLTSDNVVVWQFENINLPDSTTDFINSYGFVQYNIVVDKSKVFDGLTFGNGACLYWNYDDPNCTNKALLTYDVGVGVESLIESQLKLYPNPTTGGFTIEMSQLKLEQVEVMDLLGATVYASGKLQSNSDKYQVMLSGENPGIYIVKLHTGQGIVTRKLVLMD